MEYNATAFSESFVWSTFLSKASALSGLFSANGMMAEIYRPCLSLQPTRFIAISKTRIRSNIFLIA